MTGDNWNNDMADNAITHKLSGEMADARTPLGALNETVPPLSVSGATLTLVQNILGAGILALPYAVKCAGILGGATLFILIYVLSIFSMGALVHLADYMDDFTYKGLAAETIGPAWPTSLWVMLYGTCICVSYVILLGDFSHALALSFGVEISQSVLMVALVVIVCWPLSCAPSLGFLRLTSFFGIVSILFTTVVTIYRYFDGSYDSEYTNHFSIVELQTFGDCFPILVGAFGAHYNIPRLYREVKADISVENNAYQRMMRVIMYSLTISSIIYGTVGIVVYATFGKTTSGDFTTNFRPNDGLLVVVRICMTLAISVSFPLTMVAVRDTAIDMIKRSQTNRSRIAVATTICLCCLLLAVVVNNFGTVLAYNGAIFGTPVCYVAPAVMYNYLPMHKRTRCWQFACWTCAILGVLFSILGVIVVTLNQFT